ncbi:hypothetical protein UFOVP599_21 [uncultured Caudovirales phage]|uniref:Uncharacterized protein n=1 Tax=uncultured Caudovirales phage TaxID=2100421 RepID=A0A6J5MYB4_9CAUD|nr:hypothetical protein UFOVP599_21 [uncultured Caudovirales phage]
MNDYALPLIVLRDLSKKYEEAMLKQNKTLAYEISVDLVEMALKLSDIAHGRNENKKV